MDKPTVDMTTIGYPGLKSDPNDWFYTALKGNRDSVIQFLNSYGIEKGDATYTGVTDSGEQVLHSILRHRLHVDYGNQTDPHPVLEAVLKKISIKGDQLLGAILYLELDGKLQEILTKNIKGKNNISEENCIGIAVILAEMEMCATAIGLEGMLSDRNAAAARKGANKERYLKHDIRKICLSAGSTSWTEFKKAIKDRELIQDLYEAGTDRIGIKDFQIQGDRLLFNSRKKGEEDRSIGTIKNILSEIKL